MRPSFDDYYLGIAWAVAARADCTRRKAGTVIVKDATIIGHGYNGAPPGRPGCLSDGACPRGRHHPVPKYRVPAVSATFCAYLIEGADRPPGQMHGTGCMCAADAVICACGKEWPCPDGVPPTSSYDTGPGSCIAVHSEANAIIRAGYPATVGATLYTVPGAPCDGCQRLIDGAGITRVLWPS